MLEYTIFNIGDQALTISLGDRIDRDRHQKLVAIKLWLQQHPFPGLQDIIVAYSSLTVLYDLHRLKTAEANANELVKGLIEQAYKEVDPRHNTEHEIRRIPVCYEPEFAPDIDYISSRNNIPRQAIIELHTTNVYQVYMIGFLPGFPYMAEVDGRLAVPRKEKPRSRVEPGSVGIAGIQTGIYSVASPGGWQIIGRTPLSMFNKYSSKPVLLEPGDQVQFYAISRREFEQFNAKA